MYRNVTVKSIIAQVYRDFKPSHSGWISDAVEWIGDALGIMKISSGLVQKSKEIKVVDNKALIPCDIEMLLGVEMNNMRLPRTGGVNVTKSCSCLQNLVCHPEYGYSLNPRYILLPFKEGCITVHYEGVPTDCDGYPEVPDEPFCKKAITWYIMMQLCSRGYKHPVFNYKDCEQRWELTYPKAQNASILNDIDSLQLFSKSWLGLARGTNFVNQFFNMNQSIAPDLYNSQSLPPGSTYYIDNDEYRVITPE